MFLDAVRRGTELESTDEASEATLATLEMLSEVLTGGQAADLGAYLPPGFEEGLSASDPGEAAGYSRGEFLERVADRGVDDPETRVRAVLATAAEAASDRELENARKQLPDAFGTPFETEA